jgi:hypothetical protein
MAEHSQIYKRRGGWQRKLDRAENKILLLQQFVVTLQNRCSLQERIIAKLMESRGAEWKQWKQASR